MPEIHHLVAAVGYGLAVTKTTIASMVR